MQRSFFKVGSAIGLLLCISSIQLCAQDGSIHVDSIGTLKALKFHSEQYLFIKEFTNYKDFPLIEDFYRPLKYGKEKKEDRMQGMRGKLFYMKAKNDIPIIIYFNKRTKYIFMIEMLIHQIKEKYYLRDYLYENGADIEDLNLYIGKKKPSVVSKFGSGEEKVWMNQNCLEYGARIGTVSFAFSKNLGGAEERVTGIRIIFDNNEEARNASIK